MFMGIERSGSLQTGRYCEGPPALKSHRVSFLNLMRICNN
ncbi:hypothetical protein GGD64_000048 [Bradyrhizobium sp. CIR3A]|nr:hypothetical protein [Bradyrhizobium sp. CIR3A]MBB4392438.1 hypothetical protein [Bradyrhizobium sp. ERR14]NYG48222.1 hypothetical protein [Bradyrhizobium sp. IAR9]